MFSNDVLGLFGLCHLWYSALEAVCKMFPMFKDYPFRDANSDGRKEYETIFLFCFKARERAYTSYLYSTAMLWRANDIAIFLLFMVGRLN